ncbi:MAG TPA: anaerobic ribonucleoside-triphosphate reductase [Planctomycetota bacterium]|jgi:anaerobic ribonucleoside-triphosphate reductase|nr:hypothetical protein [Planctomycetota bacterium]OQC19103.1 MAG: Ribonucleoside-diphosphate reductase NrdZ [Planctomycetes bacterium ADurb.Bin069]NMD34317.1 hypothetical protein [Planctomycetota bacterium]HNR98967.1 anaerobic ribonucleoside-triphosphate reductase [Planctomycetota bacterium]HNU27113.1 anaerobic ribonucleoside-triphosphate reductase [Planctomycetota bacterium]
MPRISEVRKRDNRIVPFDQSKIGDAIYKAVRSVGAGDRTLADDLAAAVTLFLEKRWKGAIPSIEDIQDMVETVLAETGHAEIASAYIEYRTKRAQIREILKVHKDDPQGPEVEPGAHQAPAPWSKAKIVAALVKEADLDMAIAEQVAASVEEKVFKSGLQRISTALVRELVDNELFERGYAAKLARQAPIGVPKYNLRQIIFSVDAKEPYSFVKDPEDIDRVVAQHILRQYAAAELFSPEVAEAARDGRIVLHRVGEPLRVYRMDLGAFPDECFDDDGVTLRLVRLLRTASKETCVPCPPSPALLRELGLLAYRSRALAVTVSEAAPLLDVPDPHNPAAALHYRVELNPAEPASNEAAVAAGAACYARGFRVSFLLAPAARPGLIPAKVSLNLPQLACRSGRTQLGDIFAELDHAFGLAVKAHLERRTFLGLAARANDLPLWDLLGAEDGLFELQDGAFAVGIFGLADAVKFMTGKEAFADHAAFGLGVKIVEHLAQKAACESRTLGLRLVLEETRNARLEEEQPRRDARLFPELKEVFRGRPEPRGYSPGVRFPLQAPLDPLTKNRYLARIAPFVALDGIVDDDPELRAGGAEVLVSLLEESLSFFGGRAMQAARANVKEK